MKARQVSKIISVQVARVLLYMLVAFDLQIALNMANASTVYYTLLRTQTE